MCYFHYWCKNCKYDFPSYTVTAGKKHIQFSNTFFGYLNNKKVEAAQQHVQIIKSPNNEL